MPGFSSNSGGLDVVFANNVNFSGTADHPDSILTNGQLLIGTTALNAGGTHINVGTLTSPLGTLNIGFSSPNITLDLAGSAFAVDSFQVDTVTAPGVNPVVPTGAGLVTVTGIGGTNTFSSSINTISLTAMPQPGWNNLSIANSAGTTFTVQGYNGTALSASNPAQISLQSLATPGRIVNYKVTANQTFTQANISANTWGITSGVNWANDMPFFLYAVTNGAAGENTIAFAISRVPNLIISPVAGKLAKQGSAVATTQGSMYLLPNITVADYASSPCICLGSFRMTYASAGTTWTITTLNNADGIGEFNEQTSFAFPAGQNGNAANAFFNANGGTAPIWTLNTNTYYIDRQGRTFYILSQASGSTISTAGVGAVNLQFSLPYAYKADSLCETQGLYTDTGGPNSGMTFHRNPSAGSAVMPETRIISNTTLGRAVIQQNGDMVSGFGILLLYKFGYIADIA